MQTFLRLVVLLVISQNTFARADETAPAGNRCQVSARYLIDLSGIDPREVLAHSDEQATNLRQQVMSPSPESCYRYALATARQFSLVYRTRIWTLSAAEYGYRVNEDGSRKVVLRDVNAYLVFDWSYDDSFVHDSQGTLTKFSSPQMKTGNVMVNEQGRAIFR